MVVAWSFSLRWIPTLDVDQKKQPLSEMIASLWNQFRRNAEIFRTSRGRRRLKRKEGQKLKKETKDCCLWKDRRSRYGSIDRSNIPVSSREMPELMFELVPWHTALRSFHSRPGELSRVGGGWQRLGGVPFFSCSQSFQLPGNSRRRPFNFSSLVHATSPRLLRSARAVSPPCFRSWATTQAQPLSPPRGAQCWTINFQTSGSSSGSTLFFPFEFPCASFFSAFWWFDGHY